MQQSFDYDDIRRQFLEFLSLRGIQPYDERDIVIDGELHRYRIHDDKSYALSGAYCIFPEGLPAGFAQDWRRGIKETWKYDTSGLDNERREYYSSAAFQKKAEEERRKAEEKRRNEKLKRSEAARNLWETLKPVPKNHPYLLAKHITDYGLRYNPHMKALAVPLKNIRGQIMSYQWIPDDLTQHKSFFKGASLEGAFWDIELFVIDPKSEGVILLGEGMATMAKVHELTGYPVVAAMSCYRLLEIASILHQTFPKCKIIICADNDKETEEERGYNPGLSKAQSVVESGFAQGIVYPEFASADDGTDWDDYAVKYGDDVTAFILKRKLEYELFPKNIKDMAQDHRLEYVNAQALLRMTLPPIKWAVEGFLPSGLTILGGGPKTGKSILALHLAIGVAIGGCVLGKIDVKQGSVLYLALEDNRRRLQERLMSSSILPEDCNVSQLDLVTHIPRQHEGGLEFVKYWLNMHSDARLVIIDTLQMFRKQLSGKGGVYGEDYDAVAELKKVADEYDVAFLVIHHLKKVSAKEELLGDWINQFSGSAGLSGSADTLFILRRARTDKYGTLHRTGRDVEEKDFQMRLDGFGWLLMDDAESFTMPSWKRQIVDYLKEHATVTPLELSQTCNLEVKTAQNQLLRLAKEGLVRKVDRGIYAMNAE